MHITKYEKPDQKRYILYDFNSRNSGKNKTMETAKDEQQPEGRGNKGRVGGTQRTYFLNCKFSYASLDIFQNPQNVRDQERIPM